MQVVCEGTQAEGEDVIVSSYECLARIMANYYAHMQVYMVQALNNV